MFRVRSHGVYFCISDENNKHLHSDGSILTTAEYWPTREQAQAVLNKYQPKHVWEHGDVFKSLSGCNMIYLSGDAIPEPTCWVLDCQPNGPSTRPTLSLRGAKFLFNIKEKL